MNRTLIFSIIMIGVTAMASQIVLMRELLIVFYGNELSVAIILASWLIGGAAGSAILGALSDKLKNKIAVFGACQIAIALFLPFTILVARSIRAFLGINPGEIVPLSLIASASLMILLPLCLILGFIFSLSARIYRPEPVSGAFRIGQVYILEAIGAMIGGIVTSLVLIRYLNPMQIMVLLGLLIAVAALVLSLTSGQKHKTVVSVLAGILIAAGIIGWLSGVLAKLDNYSIKRQWPANELLASKNSIYGNIAVSHKGDQFSFFDNGLHLYTVPDLPTAEESVHFALLEHPDPKRVLLIGGGAGGLLSQILKHPVDRVDYIELDPLIIKMAQTYLPDVYRQPLADPRVSTIFEDGRRYIKTTEKEYDVIIVNLGDPYTAQLNRFYTMEFFSQARRVLAADGVLSFGLSSSESYIGIELADLLRSIYATLAGVFTDVKVIPGETAYFLASPKEGALTYDYELLMERAKSRGVELEYVREYYLSSKMSPELISYTEKIIKDRAGVEINRDFRPVAYRYGLIAWTARFKDSNFKNILKSVNAKTLWSAIFITCIMVLVVGVVGISKSSAIFSLLANGFSQMAFQVVILLAFQMIYGYMFYKLGIILTAFMAGIAVGGWAGTRICRRSDLREDKRWLAILQSGLFVYPLILSSVLIYLSKSTSLPVAWAGSNIFFILLPMFSGLLGGAIFPIAGRLSLDKEDDRGRVAGLNYGVDLFGSCLGALLTGVFLIPVLGIPYTCLAIAALNLSVLLVLMTGVTVR